MVTTVLVEKRDQQQGGSVEQTLILRYISPVIYRPHSRIMIKEKECFVMVTILIPWSMINFKSLQKGGVEAGLQHF